MRVWVKVAVLLIGVVITPYSIAITLEKSIHDPREYQAQILDNGLQVLTVTDPKAHVVGVSLLVKAGSFDEPDEWPGLAHYLEHMLFLGTKKYPDLDDFQAYLTQHGGIRNAMTTNEYTQYFFSVRPAGLEGALDRFSQFFIAPLLSSERAEKERQAIDSEFKMNLSQDAMGYMEVDKETSSPAHPYHRFNVGNLTTLSGSDLVREAALKSFFDTHYRAGNMILVVVGPQDQGTLIKQVKKYFNPLAKQDTEGTIKRPSIYDDAHKGLDIRIKTKGDIRELHLHFALPSYQHVYKQKPAQLLALLVGDESTGSLLSALKKQNWAHSLSTEHAHLSKEQDRFAIRIGLTPTGLNNINEITQATFAYLDFIKQQRFPETYFEEYKKINQLQYTYQDYQAPLGYAAHLAQSAFYYPMTELLQANVIAQKEPLPRELIEDVMQYLIPANLRRIVLSAEEVGERTSKWYQASYSVEKLDSLIRAGGSARWKDAFALPPQNQFIPKDLKVKKVAAPSSQPTLAKVHNMRLWMHQEDQFHAPKANILVNFANPIATSTPKNALLSALYSQLVAEKLQERLYSASLAGANIALYQQPRGMTLSVLGYSDKQELMIAAVLKEMLNLEVDAKQFYVQKDKLERQLKDTQFLRLYQKAFMDMGVILEHPRWHPQSALQALKAITPAQVQEFAQTYFDQCGLEMLINGNYTHSESKQIAKTIFSLHPFVELNAQAGATQVVILDDRYLWKIKSKDKEDIWLGYYQNAQSDLRAVAKTALLATVLQSPFYERLRSQKQLAYALGVMPYVQHNVSGLVFWVQSGNTSPEQIQEHVEAFHRDSQTVPVLWDPASISNMQASLANEWLQPPKSLNEQTLRWWQQIEQGRSDFDRNEKLAKLVKTITVDELKRFYEQVLDPDTARLLIVSRADKNQFAGNKIIAQVDALTSKGHFFADN